MKKTKGTLSELFFNAEQPACNHYKFTIGLIKIFFWIGLILGASPRSTGKKIIYKIFIYFFNS